jgi:hypothetical protein
MSFNRQKQLPASSTSNIYSTFEAHQTQGSNMEQLVEDMHEMGLNNPQPPQKPIVTPHIALSQPQASLENFSLSGSIVSTHPVRTKFGSMLQEQVPQQKAPGEQESLLGLLSNKK